MKLSKNERQNLNKQIINGTAKRLFETLGTPLDYMRAALEAIGLKFDYNHAIYAGQSIMKSLLLYTENASGEAEEVENAMLVLNIYRYETGRYEVTAYIS